MDTSLIINATNGNKKVTKAITNINPEKDNAILKTFAQKVNALTTNSYVDATRVDKMSVNEQDAGGGSTRELTFTVTKSGVMPYYQNDYTTIEGGVRLFLGEDHNDNIYVDVTAQ